MKELTLYLRTKVGVRILLFFMFLIFLQIAISYLFIRHIAYSQVRESLETLSLRVKHDLKYKNGRWDTSAYNADPATPYPHGSSGFEYSLYIITTEGFVIERNNPINGLLDSSDIKQLVALEKPQTITALTNEVWRVVSQPIIKNGKLEGVIFVGYYDPSHLTTTEIDTKLKKNIDAIQSKLTFSHGEIDTSGIDVRNIHYDVSFEIVNKFNKVLVNNGRIPTIIDTSYVAAALHHNHEQLIRDLQTKEPFMVITQTLTDPHSNPVGLIVLGKSIQSVHEFLKIFILYSIFINTLITLPLSFLTVYLFKHELATGHIHKDITSVRKKLPKKIIFLKKESLLMIDEERIEIPYDSNQYYLCEALFSAPKKRFEQDALLERFGEEISGENWRKVYDAMLAINKKVGIRLFLYQDKTYRINPALLAYLG